MEFSKKLLLVSGAVTLILTAFTIILSLASLPTDAMYVIAPLAWAETGAATGFYFWKAKNENRAKYAQKFLRDITKNWDAETAIRIAEIVLKD